jgi:hypothetical protein
MQRTAFYRKNPLLVTVVVLELLLLGLCPVLWAANSISLDTTRFKMKKNFGPQIPLNQPLMTVSVPLNISKLPGPWKQSSGIVQVIVLFLDETGVTVGAGVGLSVVPIQNGSYSGTMAYPIKDAMGGITARTCVLAMAMAQLGEQTMFLGVSKGGTSPNASACDVSELQLTPGTIMEPHQLIVL